MRSRNPGLLVPAAALAFAAVSGAEVRPMVYLNHFFVVVDAETCAAVESSPFMTGAFGPFEKRTTVRNDMTYTGAYWYGRRTYFELFEPDAQGPAGSSGLALGVEEPGASDAVEKAWAEVSGPARHDAVTRRTEAEEAPWFVMTSAREIPGLRVWLMEYHREFLARWYPALTDGRSIAREDVLDRYVAKIGLAARRDTALLKDVTDLTVALAPADRAALSAQLRAVGWGARTEKDATVVEGPESVVLRLVDPEGQAPGILEAGFSLRHSTEPATHRLGAATLRVEGRSARLRFRAAR